MKVLFDNSPLFSGHANRGIGTYTAFLGQALEELESKDRVFVTGLDPGVEYAAAIRDPKLDIIHYPHVPLFEFTLPLVKRSPKPKIVITVHDLIPLLYPTQYPVGLRGNVQFQLQKLAMRNVSAVITDSETSKRDIIRFLPFRADQIHVVRLASKPGLKPATKANIAQVKKLYGLPEKYVLYVGDINYNKNIPALLQSLEYLPKEVELVCVGVNFKPQDIPEWRAIDQVLTTVSDRVKFLTSVPKNDDDTLAALYSGAVCYVQPSLYEGFGLPVLEAMLCGTPVVSSNTAALKEIAAASTVLIEPTPQGIAKGVKQVLGWNKTETEKYVKQAIEHAKQFNWKQTALDTIKVYEQVLASTS